MRIETAVSPPATGARYSRVSKEMRAEIDGMPVGGSVVLPSFAVARCVAARMRHNGWEVRQRKEADGTRLWRIT